MLFYGARHYWLKIDDATLISLMAFDALTIDDLRALR